MPLATQAAAVILKTGDPIWCPGNDAPGNVSCTAPETSVAALIAVLGTKSGAGTIYFEPTYSTNDATFDPTISFNLSGLTDLTIQGGWNGSTSSPAVSGVTTFSVPLTITHWNGNVTLNDIIVTGATGDGLTVITTTTTSGKGNIALHNVKSNGNTSGIGAYLDNTTASSNITIDSVSNDGSSGSSEFSGNGGNGIYAQSKGDITLTDVIADANGYLGSGDGVYLDNIFGSGNISVTNSTFGDSSGTDGNGSNGLEAYSNGNVTIANTTANNNQEYGAYISNGGNLIIDPSTFDYNHLDGLNATSIGYVSLNNVNADNNSGSGAIISNGGSTTVDPSYFDNNGENGLNVSSSSNISVTSVTASDNGGDGTNLRTTNGTISVDPSQFNGNGSDGLMAVAYGNITLSDVIANDNMGNGAHLDNSGSGDIGSIKVTSSTLDGNIGNSVLNLGGRGLIAHSNSDITLIDVTASNNQLGGAELDNTTGNGSISLFGNNVFNDNGLKLTPSVGLYTVSNNNITLNGVTTLENGYGIGGGAFVATNLGSVSIANSEFNMNCTDCEFGFGFVVFSGGSTSLLGVTADDNGNDPSNGYTGPAMALGALILDGSGNVSVANSDFSGNCTLGNCSGGGIAIEDPAAGSLIFFDHITANGNATFNNGFGASIFTAGNANINCTTFNSNSGVGLEANISSGKTITLNGVTFSGNTMGDKSISGGGKLVNHPGGCGSGSGGGNKGPQGSLPIDIIPVTGGVDCTNYSANEIELPDQDHILLPCPTTGNATLTGQTDNQLPGKLDAKYTFVSAFDAAVTPTLDGSMTVSFKIPAGKTGANFAILSWDGTKWVNLGGSINPPGFFSVTTSLTGDFVLVTQ